MIRHRGNSTRHRVWIAVAFGWLLAFGLVAWTVGAEPNKQALIGPSDRLVLIGSGFVERMQEHDWLELLLTMGVRDTTYRNIGWGGDTVYGDARAVFGARADGYTRLLKDIERASPNVALVCYGENECAEGIAELPAFVEAYKKLIQHLQQNNVRVITMLPRLRELHEPATEERTRRLNQHLVRYNAAIRQLATELHCGIVDLEKIGNESKWTSDGVYWTEDGYRQIATEICKQLGIAPATIPSNASLQSTAQSKLLELIHRKNALFFNCYRPQNETYLFLFRKHEQGNNAVEIEQFPAVIQEVETQIAKLATTERSR